MHRYNKAIRSMAVAFVLGLLPITAALAAPTFTLSSSPSVFEPGGTMTLSINASAVTDLYGYQFSVNFDPTLFHVTSETEGPFLMSAGSTFFDGGTIDNAAGVVSFVFDTLTGLVPGASGSGLLDSISFSVLRHGGGSISLSELLAVDSSDIAIAVTAQALTVATPEPGTLALLSLGTFAMLFALRERRLIG